MSLNQAENFRLLKNLLRQLRGYGLNPYEWRLDRSIWKQREATDAELLVYHREDREFRFRAHVATSASGQVILHSLSLISL